MFVSLNVGCGADLWGDVRVDIRKTYYKGEAIKPTVIADAHCLPFRNSAFKVAKLSHLLEHLTSPSKALEECFRVTSEKLLIAFPDQRDHRTVIIRYFASLPFSVRGISYVVWLIKSKEHKWIISPKAVDKFLAKHGWNCKIGKNSVPLMTTFQSKRMPRKLKILNRLLPQIIDSYNITAENGANVDKP